MATVWLPLPNSSCLPPSHKAVIAPGLGTPPVRHSCASPQHCGRPAEGSSGLALHPPSPPPNNNKRFSLAPPSEPPNSKCACKPQIDADGISGGQSAPPPSSSEQRVTGHMAYRSQDCQLLGIINKTEPVPRYLIPIRGHIAIVAPAYVSVKNNYDV